MSYYNDEMTDRAVDLFWKWTNSKHNKLGQMWQQPNREATERMGDTIYIRGGVGSEPDGSRSILAVYKVKGLGLLETVSKVR